MDTAIVTLLFSLTISGRALYTEVRKLSGNEYRDMYRLPISSNSSLSFSSKKPLFRWDAVSNYSTAVPIKRPNSSNITTSEFVRNKNKKGGLKLQTSFNHETNSGHTKALTNKKNGGKKKRLKKRREGKRNKKKKQKIKRDKNNRNKIGNTGQNSTKKKFENISNFQSSIKRYMTEINADKKSNNINSKYHGTLAEEPSKSAFLASKSLSNIENLENSKYNNKPEGEDIVQYSISKQKRLNNKIDHIDHHLPAFQSKWKAYALRNFSSDDNECLMNNGGCEGLCINTPGSYRCHCPEGFRLDVTRKLCLDINECAARNGHGPCQGECTNTWGSFKCGCKTVKGTHLAEDNRSCTITDACKVHNCSHICINTRSGAFCSCPNGYILNEDWTTCQDIDECQSIDLQESICDGKTCKNTLGSYKCV